MLYVAGCAGFAFALGGSIQEPFFVLLDVLGCPFQSFSRFGGIQVFEPDPYGLLGMRWNRSGSSCYLLNGL
jgi:hypothetical protein